MLRFLRTALPAVLLAASCVDSPSDDSITVAAAANLARLLPDLTAAFEAEAGIRVIATVGSSGQLAQQIENGAPVDVFLSADSAWVATLERRGRVVAGTRAPYATGRLAIVSAPGMVPRALVDFTKANAARVAIANPDHAPYGLAARQALTAVGIWDALAPHVVIAENVRQTLQFAETGNVDIAIVAHSLVWPDTANVLFIADSLHDPLVQELAVIAHRPREAEARRFAEFVLGPAGRALFARFGYGLPVRAP